MRSPSVPAAAAQAPWVRGPLRRRVRGGRVTSPAGLLKSAAGLCSLGFPTGEQLIDRLCYSAKAVRSVRDSFTSGN